MSKDQKPLSNPLLFPSQKQCRATGGESLVLPRCVCLWSSSCHMPGRQPRPPSPDGLGAFTPHPASWGPWRGGEVQLAALEAGGRLRAFPSKGQRRPAQDPSLQPQARSILPCRVLSQSFSADFGFHIGSLQRELKGRRQSLFPGIIA